MRPMFCQTHPHDISNMKQTIQWRHQGGTHSETMFQWHQLSFKSGNGRDPSRCISCSATAEQILISVPSGKAAESSMIWSQGIIWALFLDKQNPRLILGLPWRFILIPSKRYSFLLTLTGVDPVIHNLELWFILSSGFYKIFIVTINV